MYFGKDNPGRCPPPQRENGIGCLKGHDGGRKAGWGPPKGQVSSPHGEIEKDLTFLRSKTATWVLLEVGRCLASRCLNLPAKVSEKWEYELKREIVIKISFKR